MTIIKVSSINIISLFLAQVSARGNTRSIPKRSSLLALQAEQFRTAQYIVKFVFCLYSPVANKIKYRAMSCMTIQKRSRCSWRSNATINDGDVEFSS